MFTGIIEEVGKIKEIIHRGHAIRLAIECTDILDDVKMGDSIAVNGICLTATDMGSNWFAADVMPETMRKTNLERLRPSEKVNLERAMKLSDRLGGHIVSGHIDGTGVMTGRKAEENAYVLTIKAASDILKYILLKGSVALDGTSLTVTDVDEECFKVSLIPLTQNITILGSKRVGETVNIECDIIGKYVEKLFLGQKNNASEKKELTMGFLIEKGFA